VIQAETGREGYSWPLFCSDIGGVCNHQGTLAVNVPSAMKILGRFLNNAEIITIAGKSYRLKDKASADKPGQNQPGKNAQNEKKARKHEEG